MALLNAEAIEARLCQYTVSSSDMYFAEVEQRDVLVGKDGADHIRIWGQTIGGGALARIGLCRVFLEHAAYYASWCGSAEARYHMENFGERVGRGLAKFMHSNPDLVQRDDPTIRALEQVFDAIGAEFTEDHVQAGVRFLVSHCPVEDAAKRSGLPYAELARHGINALCRALIHEMNPGWIVITAPDNQPELMFTLRSAMPVE